MRSLIRKYFYWLAGDKESFDAESRLLNIILLLTFVMSFWAETVNVLLRLNDELIFSIGAMFLCYGFLYYLSRVKRKYRFCRLAGTIITFPFVNFLWFQNNAVDGPSLYLFLVFYAFLIFLWENKQRNILIILFIINTVIQVYIEIKYPGLIPGYENYTTRVYDVYASYLMYFLLMVFIMYYAKNNYISEKEKAIRSDKLKSAFLANMSHEIRTPMNAILGFTNLMDKDIDENKKKQYREIINKNGRYLLKLIEDIIDISKIEADYLEIKKENFIINELLEDVFAVMKQEKEKFQKGKVELKCSKLTTEIIIYTDRTRLRQILLNLVMNAIKFTDEGKIEFGCNKFEQGIEFYVSDTGAGISNELKEKVFDRFVKSDDSDNFKYRGTGLGLSISKYLVEKLGGQLQLSSQLGKGSEFKFILPLI